MHLILFDGHHLLVLKMDHNTKSFFFSFFFPQIFYSTVQRLVYICRVSSIRLIEDSVCWSTLEQINIVEKSLDLSKIDPLIWIFRRNFLNQSQFLQYLYFEHHFHTLTYVIINVTFKTTNTMFLQQCNVLSKNGKGYPREKYI